MKLIPAIDLKNGKCVRLSKGKEETAVVYNDDPVAQAKFFEREGCKRIHIIDLDAAFGYQSTNESVILKIRDAVSLDIELGGGIRSEKKINFWFENGINYLIVGSMAINNQGLLKQLAKKFSNKLYISLDDLNGKIMINGWVKESNFSTDELIYNYNNSKIRGFVFTDITRDGMLTGINIKKILSCVKISKKFVIISGGLSNNKDLKNISNLNEPLFEGVIAGKSFYLGNINIRIAQEILNFNA